MSLVLWNFFFESCFIDHLVKLIDQTVVLSGLFHPPCFGHLFSGCICHLKIETQQKGNRMMFFTLFLYCVNLEYMLYLHNLFFT